MRIRSVILEMVLFCGMLSAAEIPLKNPQFESNGKVIYHWQTVERNDASGTAESIPYPDRTGFYALKLSSTSGIRYFGMVQGDFNLDLIPRPKAGENLRFIMTFRQKNENVANGGFVNFSFFSKKGYLVGRDSKFRSGTFDWGDVTASVVFKEFPKDAKFFQIRFFLGKTTGTVYFAEPKLYAVIVPAQP